MLGRSSQSGLFRAGAVSTPSEPSGASGQHPPYPTEMGLFLKTDTVIKKHSVTVVVCTIAESTLLHIIYEVSIYQTEEG